MPTDVNAITESRKPMSDRRLFLFVALPMFLVFFATADRSIPYHIDPFTNVISASTIAKTSSPILTQYVALAEPERRSVFGWVVESPRGPVSQYPPGTALLAAPAFLLASDGITIPIRAFNDPDAAPVDVPVPPLWPAALASSAAVALAVAFSTLSVRATTQSVRWAVLSGTVLAMGTGLWLNGAFQLWQHGPASMWVAASVYASSRARWATSGLLAGIGILTRPPMAIIAAGLGLTAAVRQRSWAPAVRLGLASLAGVAALLMYNHWLFDTLTISGGYGSGFTERFVEAESWWYVRNLIGAFVSADRGIFVWSPIVAVALLGTFSAIKGAPAWAVGSLIGAAGLLLVQFRLNRYSGGAGFFSYRYPLEAIVASTPLLAVGAKHVWESTRLRLLVPVAVLASVSNHMVALFRELT